MREEGGGEEVWPSHGTGVSRIPERQNAIWSEKLEAVRLVVESLASEVTRFDSQKNDSFSMLVLLQLFEENLCL